MGLRSLLGLPPLPTPDDPAGLKSWAAAQDRYKKLKANESFHFIPGAELKKLENSEYFASVKSTIEPAEAAKMLTDAVAIAVKSILPIAEAYKAFQANVAAAKDILSRASDIGMDEMVKKIYSSALDGHIQNVMTDVLRFREETAKLLKNLQDIETDQANSSAKVKLDSDATATIKRGTRALGVATVTPEIKAAHDQIEKRLVLLEKQRSTGKFHAALTNMFEINALCCKIEAQEGEVETATTLRDEVLKLRKDMDKEIKKARLVFSTDTLDAGLIWSFQTTDRQFEGALIEQDYKTAKSMLARLKSQAKRVSEIKDKSDAALTDTNEANALFKEKASLQAEMTRLQQATYATPRVNQQLIDLYQALFTPNQQFWNLMNGTDLRALQNAFKTYSDAAKRFLAAAKTAAAEIAAHKDTQVKIEQRVMMRYLAVANARSVSPQFVAAQQVIVNLKAQLDQLLIHREYKQALDLTETLLVEIARAELLVEENSKALQRQAAMIAKFKTHEAKLRGLLNSPAFTDTFFQRSETYRANYTTCSQLLDCGDPAGDAALDALIKEADALLLLKAENDKARATAQAEAQKKFSELTPKYKTAYNLLQKYLPEQSDVLGALQDLSAQMSMMLNNEHFLKVLELGNQMETLLTRISAEQNQWDAVLQGKKNAALKRKKEVTKLYDGVKSMSPVTPLISNLLTSCGQAVFSIDAHEFNESWGQMLAACELLANQAGQLAAQKLTHDNLVADHQWVLMHSGTLGAAAQAATQEWASSQEFVEILDRIRYRWAAALAFFQRFDPRTSRQHWQEVQRLTQQWTSRQQENLAGFDDEAKAVRRRWDRLQPTFTLCHQILPITPEIKAALEPFVKLLGRVQTAIGSGEWGYAAEVLNKLEPAAQKLASMKAAHDTATPLAEKRQDDAKREIDELSKSGELAGRPTKEKLSLLSDLLATGKPLLPDEKALQRALYENLEFDPAFKLKDEDRRRKITSKLVEDKEIRDARTGWNAKTDEQKLAVITKALAAQSAVYGIPPPSIRLFCDPSGPCGMFEGQTCTVNLNTHPVSTWFDYAKALDTALHENAHHYQHVLAQRHKDGLLDEDSDEYLQAQLFAINEEGQGYMTFDDLLTIGDHAEALRIYKTQPMEKHSYDTGEGVAQAIMAPENVMRGFIIDAMGEVKAK